jgi:hypothetical protein
MPLNFEKLRDEAATGYVCSCGKFHRFTAWVYAHWDIPISSECDACGRTSHLMQGRTFHTDEKKKAPAEAEATKE